MNKREFIKTSGLSLIPWLIPGIIKSTSSGTDQSDRVNFISDGFRFSPAEYIARLSEINQAQAIAPDVYGNGGVTRQLEEEFARLTGKEKAIYLPTGTMANEIALRLLNGNNTKVLVPENSHIYRDEADSAQSIHHLRLVPVVNGKSFFTVNDLENTISELERNEVFKSGTGTVAVENPVRRANGEFVPWSELKAISSFCRYHGYKLHLDGARVHIASGYTGIPVREYAELFDTVYISLYKYLHAAGGAMLCGDAGIIDQVPHLIKILGGTTYQSWANTAVAFHYIRNIDEKWDRIARISSDMLEFLQATGNVRVQQPDYPTNVSKLIFPEKTDLVKLQKDLSEKHAMDIRPPRADGSILLFANESLLLRSPEELSHAWKDVLSG